jgi:hypothetical protein
MFGFNCKSQIWRMTNLGQEDTRVGGASITGSVIHENVLTRIQDEAEEPLLVQQQGLETNRVLSGNIVPGNLDVRERDELEVTEPLDHFYYGKRFRIIRVRNSSHTPRDPRNYMILRLEKSLEAHERQ